MTLITTSSSSIELNRANNENIRLGFIFKIKFENQEKRNKNFEKLFNK